MQLEPVLGQQRAYSSAVRPVVVQREVAERVRNADSRYEKNRDKKVGTCQPLESRATSLSVKQRRDEDSC